MPKVSVIIPVYNVEKYLRECLDSVVNQTLQDIEIILINDGSTDLSLAICQEYAQKDDRIQVISQQNQGAGAARNAGIKIATGEYLSILDSADCFDLTMLEKLYYKAVKDDLDITVCRSQRLNEIDKSIITIDYAIEKKYLPNKEIFNYNDFNKYIFNTFVGWSWDKLYNRQFVMTNHLEFQELRSTNDMLFVFLSLVLAKRISIINDVLITHRQNRLNQLPETREKDPFCFIKTIYELKNQLKRIGYYEDVEQSFINWTVNFCYWQISTINKDKKKQIIKRLNRKLFKDLEIIDKSKDYFYNACVFEFLQLNFSKKYFYSNFLEQIFSIKNTEHYKIITILGIKIKVKINKKNSDKEEMENTLNNYLSDDLEIKCCKKFYNEMLRFDLINKYKNLVKNLDNKSINTISKILSRIIIIGENNQNAYDIFTNEEIKLIEKVKQEKLFSIVKLSDNCYAYQQYLLPINHFEASIFYYKHSIEKLSYLNKFKNKDIIDVGAYIGDSAIVLSEYTNNKIYSFEPTDESYNLLLKTIKLNNKLNKIIPIKLALGSNINEELNIYLQGSGSSINRLLMEHPTTEKIQSTTLDSFVEANNIQVGLIKVDIEGFEQEFLKGAINTIKQQKPTLLISIYHNASDFFNIKTLIEELNLGYIFQVINPIDGTLFGDTLLICEYIER